MRCKINELISVLPVKKVVNQIPKGDTETIPTEYTTPRQQPSPQKKNVTTRNVNAPHSERIHTEGNIKLNAREEVLLEFLDCDPNLKSNLIILMSKLCLTLLQKRLSYSLRLILSRKPIITAEAVFRHNLHLLTTIAAIQHNGTFLIDAACAYISLSFSANHKHNLTTTAVKTSGTTTRENSAEKGGKDSFLNSIILKKGLMLPRSSKMTSPNSRPSSRTETNSFYATVGGSRPTTANHSNNVSEILASPKKDKESDLKHKAPRDISPIRKIIRIN